MYLLSLDALGQLGNDLKEVADDQQVGKIRNRNVRVFIDRDDSTSRAHADFMLNRARNPDGDIQGRTNRLSGLAYLVGMRNPACIDRRSRSAYRAAERLGQRLDHGRERLGATQTTSTGDDDRGFLNA